MTTVHVDSVVDEAARRRLLFAGDIFVFTPRPATRALVEFARSMLEEAFAPLDPRLAQYDLPVERFVEIFAPLKPAFIHHPRTKGMVADVISELGCEAGATYIDVPRFRGVTSDGYLTSGVGYAHHPHRDTWYSAPMCQLNWWLPIYEFARESSMSFHPRYFEASVRNGSAEFNYYEWNKTGRATAASQIKEDTRRQPRPEEPLELEPDIRVVCPPGGIILFSGAQLHSTVANTSGQARYSLDFRTVHHDDVIGGLGAPNIDSEPSGTSLRDFMRATDLTPFTQDVIARYDDGPVEGVLVFQPGAAGT